VPCPSPRSAWDDVPPARSSRGQPAPPRPSHVRGSASICRSSRCSTGGRHERGASAHGQPTADHGTPRRSAWRPRTGASDATWCASYGAGGPSSGQARHATTKRSTASAPRCSASCRSRRDDATPSSCNGSANNAAGVRGGHAPSWAPWRTAACASAWSWACARWPAASRGATSEFGQTRRPCCSCTNACTAASPSCTRSGCPRRWSPASAARRSNGSACIS